MSCGEFAFGVAIGEIDFCGTVNAGVDLADLVDLTFGAAAESSFDDVVWADLATGLKIKGCDALGHDGRLSIDDVRLTEG